MRTRILTALALTGLMMGAGKLDQPSTSEPSSPSWQSVADAFGGVKAETRPCRDSTMQFSFATEVREVLVKAGQRVKEGEILLRARDAEVEAAIEQQKLVAGSDLEIKNAEKAHELAAFKFEQLKKGGTYSPSEFEEMKITAETTQIQWDQAKLKKDEQQLQLKQLQGQFERYYLAAPFDGIIEEIMVDVGQGTNEQQKVLRIVNIDKLWLDAYPSTDQTIDLKLSQGAPAWVLVDLPGRAEVVKGHVLYVSPVADSVSQTRRVRVEIDNPEQWPAGTPARVRFTAPAQTPSSMSSFKPLGPEIDGFAFRSGTGVPPVSHESEHLMCMSFAPEGRRVVATGGAMPAQPASATRGTRHTMTCRPEGAKETGTVVLSTQRPSPLRGENLLFSASTGSVRFAHSTRGYSPSPLRGENQVSAGSVEISTAQQNIMVVNAGGRRA